MPSGQCEEETFSFVFLSAADSLERLRIGRENIRPVQGAQHPSEVLRVYHRDSDEYEEEKKPEKNAANRERYSNDSSSYGNQYINNTYNANQEKYNSFERVMKRNVVNMMTVTKDNRLKISIHESITYEDGPKIIDDIINKKAAVLNIEMMEKEKKRQILDFVCGGIYALDGKIQEITKDIYLLVPKGVDVNGKVKEQIEKQGFFQL